MKRYKKSKESISMTQIKTLPCDPKYLLAIRQIVCRMWRARKLPMKQGELVALAVDEALSAIIRHARGMRRPGEITIELDINNIRFRAFIKDKTDSFDLCPLSESEQRISLEKTRKYQLGTFLICTIMDEVTYNYKRGFQNELQLIKFIP